MQQEEYSIRHPFLFDMPTRRQRGLRILAVLRDFLKGETAKLRLLDLGCSTGAVSALAASEFARVVGVDTDAEAIAFASKCHPAPNLTFLTLREEGLPFEKESFDVVVFSHVVESVKNPAFAVGEIHRVLRPGGICYFSFGNRFLRRGRDDLLTWPNAARLARGFSRIDYTRKMISMPSEFSVFELAPHWSRLPRSVRQLVAFFCYPILPRACFEFG